MSKELIARRLLRIAFLMLMIWLVLWATSCGGKKKLVQSSEYSTEIAKVERVNELVEKDVEKSTETATGTEKTAEKETENFNAEIEDPSRPASITKTEKDGQTIWNLENIKNFNAGKEKSKERTKDTTSQKQSEIDKSKSSKDTEASTDIDTSGSGEIINKQKDGKFPWPWIVVLLLLYAVVSYLRKSLNPLKWI